MEERLCEDYFFADVVARKSSKLFKSRETDVHVLHAVEVGGCVEETNTRKKRNGTLMITKKTLMADD